MSVIVKGMEMPKDCNSCWIPSSFCKLWLKSDVGNRHQDCPLIELPEKHGRLIDADAMKRVWMGARIDGDIGMLLDARPTIVEAEGE